MFKIGQFFFLALLGFIIFSTPIQAHTVGQPPFFRINGVFSNLYPVPTSSVDGFNLPQDLATDNYLVGQKLDFEMDPSKMPAPQEIINQTKFLWDFGDGALGTGLRNSHNYPKPGSYILSIKAQYKTDPTPQLIQSVLFNVLPDKGYKLPQAVIKANGKTSNDPLTDIIKIKLDNQVQFDGSSSVAGSGKIVSYQWDLGDTNSATTPILTHQYDSKLNQVFPVLRVKDENGLIADNFVEIENGQDLSQNPIDMAGGNRLADSLSPVAKSLIYAVVVIGLLLLIVLGIKFFRKNSH